MRNFIFHSNRKTAVALWLAAQFGLTSCLQSTFGTDLALANASTSGTTDVPVGGSSSTVPVAQTSPHARGATAANPNWTTVDKILSEAATGRAPNASTAGQLRNYTFQVYTVSAGLPQLAYTRSYGTVVDVAGASIAAAPSAKLKIASASKQITALTILHAIDFLAKTSGASTQLNLNTTAATLGCTGVSAAAQAITLSQLLHQVSGLSQTSHSCLSQLWSGSTAGPTPYKQCACEILKSSFVNSVGNEFVYSGNNFTVAGAIAEHALANSGLTHNGQPYNYLSWFDHTLLDLGIAPSDMYYQSVGNQHDSNLAGVIATTVPAYAQFLTPTVPGPSAGMIGTARFLSTALLAEFSTPNPDSVTSTVSPFDAILKPTGAHASAETIRYGLGNWVECSPSVWTLNSWPTNDYSFLNMDYANCAKKIDQSEGKFGYFPWVSSGAGVESRIAILATNLGTTIPRVYQVSADVHFMLEPVLDQIFKQ